MIKTKNPKTYDLKHALFGKRNIVGDFISKCYYKLLELKMSNEEKHKAENPVSIWLQSIGCGDLINKFLDNGYRDLTTISEMTKEDLNEIGIIAGFAKTILTHSVKIKTQKENENEIVEVEEETISRKKTKRCTVCHNYCSKGHKKICSGKCEDFSECPTMWIEQHEDEYKKFKKEKEEEKKKQSEEKKGKREEEKEEKKKESEQYKKIPLKSWKEFYAEKKEEVTQELFGDEEIDNIRKQKIIIEISKRYKELLKETEEENEKRKEKRKKLKQ